MRVPRRWAGGGLAENLKSFKVEGEFVAKTPQPLKNQRVLGDEQEVFFRCLKKTLLKNPLKGLYT